MTAPLTPTAAMLTNVPSSATRRATSNRSAADFLDLPTELRDEIYDIVIDEDWETETSNCGNQPLAAVSRQIRVEYLRRYYVAHVCFFEYHHTNPPSWRFWEPELDLKARPLDEWMDVFGEAHMPFMRMFQVSGMHLHAFVTLGSEELVEVFERHFENSEFHEEKLPATQLECREILRESVRAGEDGWKYITKDVGLDLVEWVDVHDKPRPDSFDEEEEDEEDDDDDNDSDKDKIEAGDGGDEADGDEDEEILSWSEDEYWAGMNAKKKRGMNMRKIRARAKDE